MATFAEIFQKNQYNLPEVAKKSATWFQQQARFLGRQNIDPKRLIRSSAELNVPKVMPGELYLFQYDAKHKDTLQYWDMFPLVFPFRRLPDGFIGLNLHYLPYQYRIILLDRLNGFRSTKGITENTRLKLSWDLISGVSRFKWAEPCVHRYLASNVDSQFKRIPAEDWATALMLPVESFVGANKRKVWTDSLR